jgi:hypothetical protein
MPPHQARHVPLSNSQDIHNLALDLALIFIFLPGGRLQVSVRLETAVRGSGVLAYRPWDLLPPFPL